VGNAGAQGRLVGLDLAVVRCRGREGEEIVVPIQINGKVRSRLTVAATATESQLESLALADPAVKAHTQGKTIRKVVVVKGKLVSLVVQ
jgi:leucyl-tRNA synthetase